MELNEQQVIENYYKLGSCRAVSEKYNCHPEIIRRILKRNDIELIGRKNNGKNQPQTKITDEQLIEACKTMTTQEIADAYGMHPGSIPRRCKRLGVYPVRYSHDSRSCESANKYWEKHPEKQRGCISPKIFGDCWHFVESQWRNFEALHPGFEYLETRGKRVRLKCKVCGAVIERADSTIREKHIKCEFCKADRELKEARQSVALIINAIAFSLTPRICKYCGKVFTSPYPGQLYCSKECKNHKKRYKASIRKRCREYGVYYDPSVTREKVIKRDNGVCQICGKTCDPSDLRWGFSGPDFPTLDHIVALANGGTHTWGNVQCACGQCNSYKRDLTRERRLEWLGLAKL